MANNYNSSPVFLGGHFAPFLGGQYSRFFQLAEKMIQLELFIKKT